VARTVSHGSEPIQQPPRPHHGKEQELPPGASANRHEAFALAEAVSRASVGVKVLPAGQLPANRGRDARGSHFCSLEGSWLGLSRGLVSCAGETISDPPTRRVMLNGSTRMTAQHIIRRRACGGIESPNRRRSDQLP